MKLRSQNSFVFCATLFVTMGVCAAQDQPGSRRVTTPGAAGSQVQINQIETSQFPKVTIFATVLKDGAPVPGLTGKDFRVREDEVDQEPLTVTPKLTPLSVVMTLDTSGSMKKRLPDAQSAAKSFVAALDPQDKFQVIRFSRDVKTLYPLGSDLAAANAAISSTVARGDTALWDALYASVESLRSVSGRKAIILLSDGVDDDGSGKPLSQKNVNDVLGLAKQVNVPIYAIGIGTELDEVNLRKIAADSGALYLTATEPAELKRLYDSIGKQLAGQYTINYTSNLPGDGSEHRVQLKFGEITSTKIYVPPVRTAAVAAPPPPPPAPPKPAVPEAPKAETIKAEAKSDTPISDKTPSADANAPVPLNLGEVVKGRLAESRKTGKFHYWAIDLPPGKYKFVLDAKRADDSNANLGGELIMMNPDGSEGHSIGSMSEIDSRHRDVFRIETKEPLKGTMRYQNNYTITDYQLGIFPDTERLKGLYFVKAPPIAPLKVGQTVTTPMIEGNNIKNQDAFYSLKLPAGDFKVSIEFRREDNAKGNVGGTITVLGPDGDVRIGSLASVSEIDTTGKTSSKLSLADDDEMVFQIRAHYTKETAILTVENWQD